MLRRSPYSVNLVQSYGLWKICPSKTLNKRKCFYRHIFGKKYCIVINPQSLEKKQHDNFECISFFPNFVGQNNQ